MKVCIYGAGAIGGFLGARLGAQGHALCAVARGATLAALKARGIEVPYMVKANEGHGFSNEENRFDFYRAMEEFLGKHLGGRVEKASE